jgi:ribonuclease H-related protein
MTSKYSKQLFSKAEKIKDILMKDNIYPVIDNNSLREYSIDLDLNPGKIIIYYSPKTDSYKYVFRTSDENLKELVEEIINGKAEGIYKNKGYEIDVDGSYINGKTAYASVIRRDGKLIKELSGTLEEVDVEGTRQVAGELTAVLESLNWCNENSVKETTIYYDYEGIEKWARGLWQAKKDLTKYYRKQVLNSDVKIKWVKIRSHTGAYWNEYADKLASSQIK